jgi:carbonic anhydrase
MLTQTKLGELFILRNAENIVPLYGAVSGGEDATIEYAVTALGIASTDRSEKRGLAKIFVNGSE